MEFPFKSQRIGPSLIIGGSGFIGSHIVEQLLKEPDVGPIVVASRRTHHTNTFDSVTYANVDVSDRLAFQALVDKVQPVVIFHAAAPRSADSADPELFHSVVVKGTQTVLDIATASPSVKALVFTSSCTAHEGFEHLNINEDAPLWLETSKIHPYFQSKAVADRLVLAANKRMSQSATNAGGYLLTVSLRLTVCYGPRDAQFIPNLLEVAQKGHTKVQLGDGSNLIEPLYAPVAADGHILAAKALLATANEWKPDPGKNVDGEAFFIANGTPQRFWDVSRYIWVLGGDTTDPATVIKIPGGLAMGLAHALDWAFYLVTLGFIKPPLNVSPLYINFALSVMTYSIDKARARLGFNPDVDFASTLESSVHYVLAHDPRFQHSKIE